MAQPDQVEKALKIVYKDALNKPKDKELEFLIVILPDNNGSLCVLYFILYSFFRTRFSSLKLTPELFTAPDLSAA